MRHLELPAHEQPWLRRAAHLASAGELGPFIDLFLEMQDLRPATIYYYKRHLVALSDTYPTKAVGDFTTMDLELFIARRTRGLSNSTKRQLVCAIRCFFRWLRNGRKIDHDPAAVIKAPSRDNSEPRYLDGEDVGLLLRAAQNDLGFQACIALGAYAGMRRGSVHALRWQDVDFESRLITVRHAKGGKHYSVPMQPKLRNILQAWQAVSKENDSGYVYAHYWLGSWRPYYYRSSAQKLAKYARIAGLDPETGFHDFRRTFATTLHNKGVDIAVISRLLGHASIATTMAHYAFTSDKSRQEAVLAIDY